MNDASAPPHRPRPRPGERRAQILQTLAAMLCEPHVDRITTAALASRLQVSEAALYRHFASKAQMFEGLIEMLERGVAEAIADATAASGADGLERVRMLLPRLARLAEQQPGMARVLIGDALVSEDDRLQQRVNALIDALESTLRRAFSDAVEAGRLPADDDPGTRARIAVAVLLGLWSRFAKSGFRRMPTDGLDAQVALLLR